VPTSDGPQISEIPPGIPSAPVSLGAPPASQRGTALAYRLAELQLRKPWIVLTLAGLLVAASLALALRLSVRPGFEALLPETRPSVRELERVKERTTGVSTVFVVLEGEDAKALRLCADAIVGAVVRLGRPWVGSAESGPHDAYEFLRPRVGLYADRDQLEGLRDDTEERWQYEVGKETGAELDLDPDYRPPALDAESVRKRFGVERTDVDRYPGGYYQSQDGRTVVVVIRSGVIGTDYDQGTQALGRIRAAVDAVEPRHFHPSIRYGLAGDLVSSISEYKAINDDLRDVGVFGAVLIFGIVLLYYLRFRTLVTMVLTIGIGVAVTFGATELLVGQLNLATGFLFTIIAGNGINSGIIYMARYLEARRRGARVSEAVREAHRETWLPTLTASAAASAAYGSLLVTEFRGFRDFGIIGGVGMVLCWACTYAFLPSILVVTERVAPLTTTRGGLGGLLPRNLAGGLRFGAPFEALVSRFPRACALAGAAATVVGVWATVRYVQGDPMEYDLRNLRSDMSARAEEVRLVTLGEKITGFVGLDAMAILVERPEQVPMLVGKLRERRDAAAADAKPFRELHTLQDFVPAGQAEKIPLLLEIKQKILRARSRGFITDDEFAQIEPYLPPEDVRPFVVADLPEALARPFTERDGTRGRVVYISPIDPAAVDDARYLFRWADAYRRTELDDASVVLGSGRAVIYADIWTAIVDDVPTAVLLSLGLTLSVVALAFRAGFSLLWVLLALLIGVAWMTGLLSAANVKLNFLNFIALPITFGIGVDYAVNVMQRYRREGPGSALTAVRETGGAVVLCSLTTTLGYLALIRSVNYAVRSLGIAAVLGEVTTLVAAVLVLPAALVWLDTRRAARAREPAGAAAFSPTTTQRSAVIRPPPDPLSDVASDPAYTPPPDRSERDEPAP
jgi:predicted exporter